MLKPLFGSALLAAALLTLFPGIDLMASRPFYDPATQDFFLGDVLYPVAQTVQTLLFAVPFATLGLLLASYLPPLRRRLPARRVLGYFLLCILLAPWLAVTGIKDTFGRARPARVTELGGEHAFTGALRVSHACDKNCSFVSGDASGGFTWLALALAARRRRRLWGAAALGTGSAIGLVRIMEGRHFLSDIVFSGLVTSAIVVLLYHLLLGNFGIDGERHSVLSRWRERRRVWRGNGTTRKVSDGAECVRAG
jgi:lipid A 4'-phosphatase